jgi:predicted AlkP superfamily pyrophosphatase or phosphodiesterase
MSGAVPSSRVMRAGLRSLAVGVALVAAVAGCHATVSRSVPPHALVLVSIDGFRSDDFDLFPSPVLHRLAARGVRAERLIPSFPSKTYPNHFTLVTGRRPEHHGIVANDMVDPATGAVFSLADRKAVADPSWWQAEPIWVTAERAGMRTAPLDWPGTEAPIGGLRPAHWRVYDAKRPNDERVQVLLELLAKPPPERPRFLTLYFSDVDDAGHAAGPHAPAVGEAIARVDGELGTLVEGIDRLGATPTTDVVVVSDHGMAEVPAANAIFLDDLVDAAVARVVTWSPVLELWPQPERVDEVIARLRVSPHLAVYRREDLPARLHYADNARIPPVVALAEEGWYVTTHGKYAERDPAKVVGGEHGNDPALPSMGALFVAAGPSFARGRTVPAFDNVEVYPLLCAALGIAPVPGDWTVGALPGALAPGLASRLSSTRPTTSPSPPTRNRR